MKKAKKIAVVAGSVLSMGIASLYFGSSELLKAAPGEYETLNQTNTPGINIINSNGQDESGNPIELPGDYGTFFKLTDKVTYEVKGESAQFKAANTLGTKIYRFNKNDTGEKSVIVRNAAVYNGKLMDLKMVIDDIELIGENPDTRNPYFNFIAVTANDRSNNQNLPITAANVTNWGDLFLFFGSGNVSSGANAINDKYSVNDNVSYHYEFYDSASGNPVQFKGVWNFSNVNGLKAVSLPHVGTDFSDFFVRQGTTIKAKKDYKADTATTGYLELYGTGTAINLDTSKISQTFGADQLEMNMQRRSAFTGITTTSPMGILYDQIPVVRIAPSTPIVFGEKNSASHNESDYLTLKYTILQTVAKNSLNNRSDTFQMYSQVPDYYDVDLSETKIYEYGENTDVTGRFKLTHKSSTEKNKLVITANDPKAEAFDGVVYEVKVRAKPNSTFDFKTNKALYGYQSTGEEHDGYMTNFEMGGTDVTYTSYTFSTLSKSLHSDAVVNQTKSQVRYNGVPSADAREDILYPVGTDFSSLTQQEIEDTLIENITVDTNNIPLDEVVTIEIDQSRLPDTSSPGEVTVYVVLTTKEGVKTTVPVTVTIGQVSADLTVRFVDRSGNDLTGYGPVVLTGTIGETTDLTGEIDVTEVLGRLAQAGYDIDTGGRPANETAVEFVDGGSEVRYVLFKVESTLTVEFVYLSRDGNYKSIPNIAPVVLTREVGTSVNLTSESAVTNAITKITSGRRFTLLDTGRPSDETGVLVERAPKTVRYVFTGQLKLESVPSLNFRTQAVRVTEEIKVNDPSLIDNEHYTASDEVDNKDKLVISDYRDSSSSWTLSVKLLSPLLPDEANPDTAYVLADAIRYQTGSEEVIITDQLRNIVTEAHEGQYDVDSTWTPAGTGFKLELPAGAVNKLGKYKATMQYVLSNTPTP